MTYSQIAIFFILVYLFLGTSNEPQHKDLYVMYSDTHELFKIGISNNPNRRVNEVRRDIGGEVALLKVYPQMARLENDLHNRFYESRILFKDNKGAKVTEWFCLSDKQLMTLDSIVINQSIEDRFCHINICE